MRSPNARPRRIGSAGSLFMVFALALPAAATTTYTWNNAGGGNWSDASNWSPNGVPSGAGDVALLGTLGAPYVVALDADPAAGEIQLQDGATLALGAHSLGTAVVYNHGTIQGLRGILDGSRLHNLAGGTVTTADFDSIVVGDTLTNDGTIVVGPYRENALFMVGPSRIEGSGTIRLEGSARINCPLERPQRVITLTIGANQTLTGAGDVWVPIKNEGRILQDTGGGAELILHTYLFNYGTIRVAGGGWINVDCPLVKQYGGTIVGRGGTFTLDVGPGNLGSIDNLNGGSLVADGGDLTISALGIFGGTVNRTGDAGAVAIGYYSDTQNLVVTPGAELRVDGLMDIGADGSTLENHGTVRIRGTLNILGFPGNNISFTGDGQVVMEGGTLGTPAGALLTNSAGHTITGCGTISANIDNQGVINVDCGNGSLTLKTGVLTNRNRLSILRGNLVLHGDRVVNRGTIDGSAGTIKVEYGATLENQAGAQPVLAGPGHFWIGWKTPASTIQGGTLQGVNGGDYTNVGQAVLRDVRVDAGSTFQTIAGATTRASGARFDLLGVNRVVGTGAFVVDPATEYNQSTGATVLEGGTLTVPGGYVVQGVLSGRGTVVGNVVNDGEIRPAIGPDALRIQGDYAQSQTGHVTIGLAGAASGEFARLAVSGCASLAGAAYIETSGGFAPSAGQDFAILTAASRSGEFSAVAADPGLLLSAVYGSAGVTLEAQSTVGVIEPAALPRTLRLAPRGIGFVLELPRAADVSVRVYDVRGREVAVLAEGAKPAGFHPLDLAQSAPGLGNGVYFARASVTSAAGREVRTARVVFLR